MKTIFTLLLTLIFISGSCQDSISNKHQQIVFKNVSVIPMDKNHVLENQDLVTFDGHIISMGRTGRVKFTEDALVIDGTGKFLIPGLAEMHAHIPPIDNMEPMKEILLLFVTHGITTIRGMLGHPKHLPLREMISTGKLLGPRFYTSGPSLNGNSVKDPSAGAEMVRLQRQQGYDFLKLHPGLTKEKFDSIAQSAKIVNISFAGHVSYDVGVWHAIRSGYSTIDHLDGFIEGLVPGIEEIPESEAGLFGLYIADKADTSGIKKLMTALKDAHVWVVPTQALTERWFSPSLSTEELLATPEMIYISPAQRKAWMEAKNNFMNQPGYDSIATEKYNVLRRKLIHACQTHGVGLLLGSDAPQIFNVPGPSTHHELQYLVNSGLSPYEALKTGTINTGIFYGDNKMGVIKKGAYADLILLGGNPLEDIRQTRNIEGVMVNGTWLSVEYIRKALKSLEKH